jgi:hypothetical protein
MVGERAGIKTEMAMGVRHKFGAAFPKRSNVAKQAHEIAPLPTNGLLAGELRPEPE